MIPTLANIRKAIYCLNKKIRALKESEEDNISKIAQLNKEISDIENELNYVDSNHILSTETMHLSEGNTWLPNEGTNLEGFKVQGTTLGYLEYFKFGFNEFLTVTCPYRINKLIAHVKPDTDGSDLVITSPSNTKEIDGSDIIFTFEDCPAETPIIFSGGLKNYWITIETIYDKNIRQEIAALKLAIEDLVGLAPEDLDTIAEAAQAIVTIEGDIENILRTIDGLNNVYAPKVENGYIENPDIDGVNGQILSLDSQGNTVWSNPAEGSVVDSTMSDISENPVQNKIIKSYVDAIIYDISVLHPTSGVSGGNTYASLSDALAVIPQDKQKGGMSVKYVQSSDNKYVQYFLTKDEWSSSEAYWEKINLEEEVSQLQQEIVELEQGTIEEKTYQAIAGTTLNTTASGLNVNVPAGKKVVIQLSSDIEGLLYKRVNAFYAKINNSFVNQSVKPIIGALNEYVFDSNVTAFGFLLVGSGIPANGNITISAELESDIGIDKQLQILKDGVQKLEENLEAKADKEQNYNLFNPNSPDIVRGSYINSNGGIASNSNYFITQPFAIAPGESITSNKLGAGSGAALFESASDLNSSIAVFVKMGYPCTLTNITNTTLYARFSLGVNTTEVIINKGTASLPYVPYYASNPPKVLYDDNLNFITQELGNDTEKTISQAKMTELLGSDFGGNLYISDKFSTTAGTNLNTTSKPIPFSVKKGDILYLRVIGDENNANSYISTTYYKRGSSWITISNSNISPLYMGHIYVYVVEEDTDYFGFFSTGNVLSTGWVQFEFWTDISVTQKVGALYKKKYTLSDIVRAWLNGEKSPIAFIGDSTTDGVSTTGWTVQNSHPRQDARNWLKDHPEYMPEATTEEREMAAQNAGKGRGTVDYICTKAYPYLLEKLIQDSFGNSNARVYNVGYYGMALTSFNTVEELFGDVYSDTRMAGIVLGINDRTSDDYGVLYNNIVRLTEQYVLRLLALDIVPFIVTNQLVTQSGSKDSGNYVFSRNDDTQTIVNKAKVYVAEKYGLEVVDMNGFDQLLLLDSSYSYNAITENLHFKDLGHKLEADYLYNVLVPWINRTEDTEKLYVGFNGIFNRSEFSVGANCTTVQDKFKRQINYTKNNSNNFCIFDAYIFNNSHNGVYTVKYFTPVASGYIVIDGDTSNPITINSTEMTLDPWDIGLHHVQVYTGESTTVAFKGFLLEQQN